MCDARKTILAENDNTDKCGDTSPQECDTLEVNYFINSSIVNYNISELESETLRRMEIYVLRLLHRFNCASARVATRSTTAGPAQLHRLRNELLVLQILHKNLHHGIVSTQRDIFYRLVRYVRNQDVVNAVVQQLVATLKVPRQALGVVAGSRGCVGGTLTYRGIHLRARSAAGFAAAPEEGSAEGAPIPSTEEEVRVRPMQPQREAMEADTDSPFCILPQTRFILVIEKHAVFYRLMAERLYQSVPCVLVTSHGFPTHTARLLVHNLHQAAPHLPVVGLVDYNPSGLAILLQYKWGGAGMRENAFTCVPALRWLGARSAQLPLSVEETGDAAPTPSARGSLWSSGLQHKPFTPRDTALLSNLVKRIRLKWEELKREPSYHAEDLRVWLTETTTMQHYKMKVELEALYALTEPHYHECGTPTFGSSSSSPFRFSMWVCQHLLRRDYI